ncbi:MAG TPA: hypothetical protein V6D29_03140 [Leptolyngbyaceae cyanobacterium]
MTLTRVAITSAVAIVASLSSPALAIDVFFKAACLHPIRGEETCEIALPESDEGSVWDVTWQDGITTRIRFSENDAFIQQWDAQSNQWVDSSSIGMCWDRKCLHFSLDEPAVAFEEGATSAPLTCDHPVQGRNTCETEYVTQTEGFRVRWPDGSVDHFIQGRFQDGNGSPMQWSHDEKQWVEVENFGLCFDERCILLDQSFWN